MFRRALCLAFVGALLASPLSAQETVDGPDDDDGPALGTEEPDPTRLDVERLPPEAIQITRALYAHGFFVEAQIGAFGLVNGAGAITDPGPWASIAIGVEILDWLHILLAAEGSMHTTNAPPPPRETAYELLGGSVGVRLQANITEAFALWLMPQFAILVATTDILNIYGFQDASTVGIAYGGEVGIDWHFRSLHSSIGLLGGVRHYPSLEGLTGGDPALGIHGSIYLRYVF